MRATWRCCSTRSGAAKVGELVGELPGHARPHRERLGQSRASGDTVQMAAAAHALTGMAANLGLTGPAELSAAIEDACRSGRAGEVGDLCEQWSLSFDRSVARLRTLCHGQPAVAVTAVRRGSEPVGLVDDVAQRLAREEAARSCRAGSRSAARPDTGRSRRCGA